MEIRNTEIIRELKIKICEKFSLENVRLFCGGKELAEKQKVLDYNIDNNAFIEVV